MNALDIGFCWLLRGEIAIGSGWLSRARRLLQDQPECAGRGFLAWLDAAAALDGGDLEHVHENLDLPGATFLYTTSTLHCMTGSLALGGTGLGTAWGEQLAVAMLGHAGFAQVDPKSIDTDPFNTYYVATKG